MRAMIRNLIIYSSEPSEVKGNCIAINWTVINEMKGSPNAGINRMPPIATLRSLFNSPFWLFCFLSTDHILTRDRISNVVLIRRITTIGPRNGQLKSNLKLLSNKQLNSESQALTVNVLHKVATTDHNKETTQPIGIKYLYSFLAVWLMLTTQIV